MVLSDHNLPLSQNIRTGRLFRRKIRKLAFYLFHIDYRVRVTREVTIWPILVVFKVNKTKIFRGKNTRTKSWNYRYLVFSKYSVNHWRFGIIAFTAAPTVNNLPRIEYEIIAERQRSTENMDISESFANNISFNIYK